MSIVKKKNLGLRFKGIFRAIFSLRVLIVTVITLVLLEVTLNVWLDKFADMKALMDFGTVEATMKRRTPRFIQHHYLNYALSPTYNRGGTHHNRNGYRKPNFRIKKPKETFRIATIGGSTTYTEFVGKDKNTYPARLEYELKKKGYSNVEVVNAGVPGYTSWESLINFEFRVLDLDPDMVIIYQNVNDVHARLVDPALYRGDNSGYRKPWDVPETPWYEHISIVRVILRLTGHSENIRGIESLTQLKAPVHGKYRSKSRRLKKNRPVYYERNIQNMIAIAKANGVRVLLATWAYNGEKHDYISRDYYQKAVAEHNEIMKSLGRKHHVPVYDFADEMPGAECRKCWKDGRHVTRQGAAKKARLFAEFIDEARLIPVH
jgi:lysophospholipase L1-like esterase